MTQLSHPIADALSYTTAGGIRVTRASLAIAAEHAIDELVQQLDSRRGVLLSSGYDYPGRYTRWDLGFVDPPLVLSAHGRHFEIEALNARGTPLLRCIEQRLTTQPYLEDFTSSPARLRGRVRQTTERFVEEHRSRQPSIFSVLRDLVSLFSSTDDPHLGLYGAFGYDLCFQFEPVPLRHQRPSDQRDLVLYLPDNLIVVDHQKERASRLLYDFEVDAGRTHDLPREGNSVGYEPARGVEPSCDHATGEYAASVRRAKESFKCGDLFELVLSQTFKLPCPKPPSEIFQQLRLINPAPYALLLNLGQNEYLVGASPEMYVRVDGRRVETCPISGTIPRGTDPVEDAERIRELLASTKDESELTMCTDVDRNDKSRICVPGSVKVLGRRQIELYSRLIHTVDHVEGTLREEFDALDAFLTHTWAVTVTGAPKPAAIARVENDEKSPRAWYGGAIGVVGFDGSLNTGLTLRTVRLKDGVAEVRAGATLLYDSDPDAEEAETRVKASAFLDAVSRGPAPRDSQRISVSAGQGSRLLLVDHEDSFVHTLANYFRQTGADVRTVRWGFEAELLDDLRPDVVVLSPGPGEPKDFRLSTTIAQAIERNIPLFGVCLGLQGIVEHFGGQLGVLDYPMHGKPSLIHTTGKGLFANLPRSFRAGRYHSLFAKPPLLPQCLEATAHTEDGVIMAIEHVTLPIAAVQFHPESILSLAGDVGLRLIDEALRRLRSWPS